MKARKAKLGEKTSQIREGASTRPIEMSLTTELGYRDQPASNRRDASQCVQVVQNDAEVFQQMAFSHLRPCFNARFEQVSVSPRSPQRSNANRICRECIPPSTLPSTRAVKRVMLKHRAGCCQTSGPALITSSVASSLYFLKLSTNSAPSLVTSSLKSAVPVQLFFGFSSSSGTPAHVFGTLKLKVS